MPRIHLLFVGMCGLMCAACAQIPTTSSSAPTSSSVDASASNVSAPKQVPIIREEPLPKQGLTGSILYQTLVAEIAAQRGQMGLAVSAYIDLAAQTKDPRVARRAAEFAFQARDLEAATTAGRLWVEADPDSSQARQMLAGLLVSTGHLDEAAPHVSRLLQQDGANLAEGLLRLHRVFARQQDKQAVFRVVERVVEPYQGIAEAHFALAQAAAAAEKNDRALDEITKATSLRPDWEQAVLVKADLERRTATETAILTLRRYLAVYPKAREARLFYARMLVGEKRYDDARREFQNLRADFAGDVDVLYAIGVLSMQLEDVQEAEKVFSELAVSGQGEANMARLYLGQIAEDRKQYADARKWYGAVTRVSNEHYTEAQIRIAGAYAKEGKLDVGLDYLQKIEAHTAEERVRYELAQATLLRDGGRVQEAYDLLEGRLADEPNQPELLYETALLADRLNHWNVTETNLRKLIELRPEHAHAYNALGYSLVERNERLEEAQELISKALQFAPEDPFILDSMGWVRYRRGDLADALKYLQKAFLIRNDPEIAAHLGEVLWMSGRRDDAKKTWRDAALVSPDNEVLTKVIKRFQQ